MKFNVFNLTKFGQNSGLDLLVQTRGSGVATCSGVKRGVNSKAKRDRGRIRNFKKI
jgi:hypothetical protein